MRPIIYFLPAWSGSKSNWEAEEPLWYSHKKIEFDDTVNQVRMFAQAGQAVELVVPTYFPNYRHFAFRQRLSTIQAFNIFDYLQQIPRSLPQVVLDPRDFNWPSDATLVYGPNELLIYRGPVLYARVEQGLEGNLLGIDRYDDEQNLVKRLDFDDRGFLSRISYYQAGKIMQQDYLDINGSVQFSQDAAGRITLADPAALGFSQDQFPNLGAIVQAGVKKFFDSKLQPEDLVVVAAQADNLNFASQINPQQLILSYFYNREKITANSPLAQEAALVLADSDHNYQLLHNSGVERLVELPPFDARLNLGASNQEASLQIFFLADDLTAPDLKAALREILLTMENNHLVELTIGSYKGYELKITISQILQELQDEQNFKNHYTFDRPNPNRNLADDAEKQTVRRVKFVSLSSEKQLIQLLQAVRVIVNLAAEPDLFLQLAGISSGLPQILRVPSQYVLDHQNGLIISQITDLQAALTYYLDGLKHWNEALVFATQMIKKYTGPEIVAKILETVNKPKG